MRPELYVSAGTEHPEITFARFDDAYDAVQSGFAALAGSAADDLVTFIDQIEGDIDASGVDGVRLVDWFTALVDGDVPADVRYTECR